MRSEAFAASWRAMVEADLAAVGRLREAAYGGLAVTSLPLRACMARSPRGCLALSTGAGLAGYAIGHPWRRERDPNDDGPDPLEPDAWLVRDVAIHPRWRGLGYGTDALRTLAAVAMATGLRHVRLHATGRAASFWSSRGLVADVGTHWMGGDAARLADDGEARS